jgi:hypothetical protein
VGATVCTDYAGVGRARPSFFHVSRASAGAALRAYTRRTVQGTCAAQIMSFSICIFTFCTCADSSRLSLVKMLAAMTACTPHERPARPREIEARTGPGDVARAPERDLALHENVRYILRVRAVSARARAGAGARTFSSQRSGRCSRISSGSVSAVRMMNSAMPRFSVFVAAPRVSVYARAGGTGQAAHPRSRPS